MGKYFPVLKTSTACLPPVNSQSTQLTLIAETFVSQALFLLQGKTPVYMAIPYYFFFSFFFPKRLLLKPQSTLRKYRKLADFFKGNVQQALQILLTDSINIMLFNETTL